MSALSIAEPQTFESLLSLKGKVAIVTGGSRGIGKQVVTRFAQAGAKVVFTGRGLPALEAVEKELTEEGYDVAGFQADVSIVADSQKTVEFAVKKYGRLDILVNNAASFPFCTGLSMTEEIWDKCFAVDSKGNFFMAKLAAEEMIREGHGGRIINFLSTAALNPTSPLIAYGSAKQAVWYFTQTLAQELAPYQITVNAATPGATMTAERIAAFSGDTAQMQEFIEKSGNAGLNVPVTVGKTGDGVNPVVEMLSKGMPMGRTGYPDDLAKAVLFLASDMAEYISGVNIVVDGAQSLKNPMVPTGGVSANADSSTDASAADEINDEPVGQLDKGLGGKWKASMNTPMGAQEITLNYAVQGDKLTGNLTIMGNTIKILDGIATQDGFSHSIKLKVGLLSAKGKLTGKLSDGKLSGSIKGPMGDMPFEGHRIAD